ncbi:elongation factor P 5-aminopentanone reductase [Laceyella sacchari]|uniref:SDR family oxidoreductase n=1 Tax=Laceyella sacchari TaxID=37482 RepID=A0ABY5TYJ9_LACSH|nr:SDR family oxidoreductase [Laceyella sacchari]TCW41822.1 3-oxoacyl-[acyl-carrier protein] reductase [Laceyella sacchari]UWE02439.1 SDR family oxidoreductase [Laceyella sacchari]
MEVKLAGEVAWVTGASGGIGAAVAEVLAEAGAAVAVGYLHSAAEAQCVVERCQTYGRPAFAVRHDVARRDSVDQAHQAIVSQLGAPTVLIHAAGQGMVGFFQDHSESEFDDVMDVHVRGFFHLAQVVLPSMLNRKHGRIVAVSSIWGQTGGALEVLYSAAKGAQIGMVKALAKELARSGITVNAVAPGAIHTKLLDGQLTRDEQKALADDIPMGRLGAPNEVAHAVKYLCSGDAGYVTGQVLAVNGGWYT